VKRRELRTSALIGYALIIDRSHDRTGYVVMIVPTNVGTETGPIIGSGRTPTTACADALRALNELTSLVLSALGDEL
jgi:hypothetical protein